MVSEAGSDTRLANNGTTVAGAEEKVGHREATQGGKASPGIGCAVIPESPTREVRGEGKGRETGEFEEEESGDSDG